jgi:hypothetical protein
MIMQHFFYDNNQNENNNRLLQIMQILPENSSFNGLPLRPEQLSLFQIQK